MSPKFRGDENDWLDSSGSKRSKKERKEKKPRSFVASADQEKRYDLDRSLANAQVVEVFPNQCRVLFFENHQEVLVPYRRVGLIDPNAPRGRSPVVVGDYVVVQKKQGSLIIDGVCQRRNRILRLAPGRAERNVFHVIAVNLDQMVIVSSALNPAFSSGLVDRFLIIAEREKIVPILVVSKVDLLCSEDQRPWAIYRDLGYQVIETSVEREAGLQELWNLIGQGETVFCGHSGVGKTSLLRHYLGEDLGRVQKVNSLTGKGKHTTSSAIRYPVSRLRDVEGGIQVGWVDTPGVRELSLAYLSEQEVAESFPEFRNISCVEEGCLHRDEEGCGVREASLPRYPSYLRILESISE